MTDYKAAIYSENTPNPTVVNADAGRKNIAVCLSGGGSRALACAWGQLLGLSKLKGPTGKPLLDQVRYISSVSGGSWAAVLYTFRPGKFSDAEFLGDIYDPAQLFYDQEHPGGLNVSTMGASALGKVPQNFANLFELDLSKNIIADFIAITLLKGIPLKSSARWLWLYIVGKNVLADFDLYTFQNSIFRFRQTPWNYPDAKFFSLSKDYAERQIFSKDNPPPQDAFVYARTNRADNPDCPMLIVNTNIVGKDCSGVKMSGPLQIPTQVSPVAAGIYGGNPCVQGIVGGGCVESFGFTSSLSSLVNPDKVSADFSRMYALADITACSSAFYAAALATPLRTIVAQLMELSDDHLNRHFSHFLSITSGFFVKKIRTALTDMNEELKSMHKAHLVPQYNYWPVGLASQAAAANSNTEFTDGGDLENTGVAGLLAQVRAGAGTIISFVNGSEVLEFKNGQLISAPQMAPLFGVAYDQNDARFENYLPNGVNPFTHLTDPMGFLQVFDNSNGEFDALRHGLYETNGSGAKTGPAYCLQSLQVVKNTLLGLTEPKTIKVLWVQNAVVLDWQNRITDPALKQKIAEGQQASGIKGDLKEFADFPYYSTFFKIHQTAAETNTLAQMWAWCVSDTDSPLSAVIADLFEQA